MEYLFIGIGGFMGALARYAVCRWVSARWQGSFPTGTFTVNVSGSFLVGLLVFFFNEYGIDLNNLRAMIIVGFLGAYTTYSAFAFEIAELMRSGKKTTAASYLLASLTLGIAFAFLGLQAARLWFTV